MKDWKRIDCYSVDAMRVFRQMENVSAEVQLATAVK